MIDPQGEIRPAGSGLGAALARISEIRAQAAAATGAPTPAGFDRLLDSAPAAATASGSLPTAVVPGARTLAALPVAPSGGYGHPTAGTGELIGTPHAGTHTLGNWQSDNAIDLRIPEGTPIYAVADGVIGDRIGPLDSSSPRFAGERLTLETAGNAFYYAHLSRITVQAGQPVVAGQLLGYSGSANGVPHLHFGMREGDPVGLVGG